MLCVVLGMVLGLAACGEPGRTVELPEVEYPVDTLSAEDCVKCVVITEQARPSVRIVETETANTVWEWRPGEAKDLEDAAWFSNPDEAKPVYERKYLLVTASGGGVALIRIADKKVVFQAYAGGNPHSAEILPDGNIVTASSTGNYLTLFHVDTLVSPENVYKRQIPIPFGHNVVWDRKRERLWSAAKNKLYAYEYDLNCLRPGLALKETFQLPGSDAHDLFPVYGKDSLWFTNTSGAYYIDLESHSVTPANLARQEDIKSVSSGPAGFPVIIMKPQEKWWSDTVLDSEGNVIFREGGLRIYKARWFLENPFSYPPKDHIKMCN